MLDLHFTRQVAFYQFSDSLNATVYAPRNFYRAYYVHSEYHDQSVKRIGPVDANAVGTVVGISVIEAASNLVISIIEETMGEFPLLTINVPDEDFRHFLLIALKTDLYANRLKQIWSRGRLLQGTLEAIKVPVLIDASATVNIEKIHQFMHETRVRANTVISNQLGERATQIGDPLSIGDIESEIADLYKRIDAIVFQIYGIHSPEEKQLIDSVLA
jgi:hypothetical protein